MTDNGHVGKAEKKILCFSLPNLAFFLKRFLEILRDFPIGGCRGIC